MIKNLIITFKPILRLALILSYPLLVLICLGWFLMPYTNGYIKESLAFLLLTLILIAIVVIIPINKLRLWFSLFTLLLLNVLCFIKLSFYYNYGLKLSASALFVIFETNAVEASDFLYNYFNAGVIGFLLVLVFLLFIAFIQLKRYQLKNIKSTLFLKVFSFLGIICSIILIHFRFLNENILFKSYKSYQEYTQTKANLKASLAQETSSNITVTNSLEEEQTYVVILGESASRWHMQLYGYDRETNPLLTAIKDELFVYNDVITTNVHTIIALDKLLTLSDYNDPNIKNNASIVQLANEAGFTTYWISNQKPVGLHESIPTLIGSAATEQYFLAADDFSYTIHDETLLPVLDSVLSKSANKKLIFMHLIGNHGRYSRRYPEAFNYFKDNKTNAKFKRKDAFTLINEYDNSMLYNDFIVSQVIKRVKAKNTNSYVLYFSDHGDEVFDTIDFVGHSEYHATKPMYEVPFLVWFSKEYKSKYLNDLDISNVNKPYILEDFIHSFSDLSHISFKGLNPEKSIFNSAFKPKVRYIKDGQDYDKK